MHSRYGPSFRSSAKSALHRRASTGTVTHPSRLPATGPTDHCPRGTLTHKVVAPLQGAPKPDPNPRQIRASFSKARTKSSKGNPWISFAKLSPIKALRRPPRAFGPFLFLRRFPLKGGRGRSRVIPQRPQSGRSGNHKPHSLDLERLWIPGQTCGLPGMTVWRGRLGFVSFLLVFVSGSSVSRSKRRAGAFFLSRTLGRICPTRRPRSR